MQTISPGLQAAIGADAQTVQSQVVAEWINSRSLTGINAYSSSDVYTLSTLNNPSNTLYWRLNNTTGYQTFVVSDSPVAYWRMNETSLGTLHDVMNKNPGTIVAALLNQGGITNDGDKCMGFNIGTSGQYCTIPTDESMSLRSTGELSIEAWILPRNVNLAGHTYQPIVTKSSTSANQREWELSIVNGSMRWEILTNKNTPDDIYKWVNSVPGSIQNNVWYHVVGTFDGTTMRLFLNGAQVAESQTRLPLDPTNTKTFFPNIDAGLNVEIGSRVGDETVNYFIGAIDEVAIYNKALPSTSIQTHYNQVFNVVKDQSREARQDGNFSGPNLTLGVPGPLQGIDSLTSLGITFNSGTGIIALDPTGNFSFDGPFTAEIWFKIPGAVSSRQTLIQKGGGLGGNSEWEICINGNGTIGGTFIEGSIYDQNAVKYTLKTANNAIVANQWFRVCIQLDNHTGVETFSLVLNSMLAASTSIPNHQINTGTNLTVAFRAGGTEGFSGSLSEISLFNSFTYVDSFAHLARYNSAINSGPYFSGVSKIFNAYQACNGETEYSFPWAICDSKDGNGSFFQLSDTKYITESTQTTDIPEFNYGWHSRTVSANTTSTINGTTTYALPQTEILSISFDAVQVNNIDIWVPQGFGTIQTYSLSYKDGNNNWISLGNFVWPTTQINTTSHPLNLLTTVTGICIQISGLYNPIDVARILELSPTYRQDVSSDVITIDIKKTRENYDTSVPFGATSANTCDITLDNTTGIYNRDNIAGPLFGLVGEDVKFTVALAWQTGQMNYVQANNTSTSFAGASAGSTLRGFGLSSITGANIVLRNGVSSGDPAIEYITLEPNSSYNKYFNKEGILFSNGMFVDVLGGSFKGSFWIQGTPTSTQNPSGLESVQQGIFYSDTISIDTSSMKATFQCRDFSKYFQENTNDTGVVLDNITAGEAVGDFARFGGIPDREIQIVKTYSDAVFKSKPNAYWKMDETGQSNLGIASSGNASNFIYVPYYSGFSKTTSYTFEMWFKYVNTTTGATGMFAYGTAANGTLFSVHRNGSGFLEAQFSDGVTNGLATTTYNACFSDNLWHHLVVSRNNSTGGTIIYVDGTLVYFGTIAAGITHPAGGTILLGSYGNVVSGQYLPSQESFTVFDTFRIWNSSAASISDLIEMSQAFYYGHETTLSNTASLIDCFPIDEGQGILSRSSTNPENQILFAVNDTTITQALWVEIDRGSMTDEMGYANGTWYGNSIGFRSPPAISSEVGFSVDFDGATNFALVNPTPQVDINANFTVEAWLYYQPTGATQYFMSNDSVNVSTTSAYQFGVDSSGHPFISQVGGATITSPTALVGFGWTYVVFTGLSFYGQSLSIYINGALAIGTSFGVPIQGQPLQVGRRGVSGNFWAGRIDALAIYPRPLGTQEIQSHYLSGTDALHTLYPHIWTDQGETMWDSMLRLATADMGMVFFDEFENFVYQPESRFYASGWTQFRNSQYSLSDLTNIIDGSETIAIQANRVIVKVYPTNASTVATTEIWSAPSNESLAVSKLIAPMGTGDQSLAFYTQLNSGLQRVPLFLSAGYVKIGDEIIHYTAQDGQTMTGLTRGCFNTPIQAHALGDIVGEVREYSLQWNNSPVSVVQYPFCTAEQFDHVVDLSGWRYDASGGYVRVSVNGNANATPTGIDPYIFLEGTNPLTGLDEFFRISGVPVKATASSSQVMQVAADFDLNTGTIINQFSAYVRSHARRKHLKKDITIDNEYIQDQTYATQLADFILNHYKDPVQNFSINTMGIPHLQLGDRVTIVKFDAAGMTNKDFWIMDIDINYDGGIRQTIQLREVDA